MALSNSQYESIIRTYERTRDENHQIYEEHVKEAYEKLPELAKLDEERGRLMESRLSALFGEKSEHTDHIMTLEEIALKRKMILTAAGYPMDYLSPVYTCPDCQDTGYITDSEGIKSKCHCFRKQEMAILYEQSNIQDFIEQNNFSTLSYEYCEGEDLERLRGAVKISLDFVKSFQNDYRNIIFFGTVGTGKSFLSGCIARELLNMGHSVIYFSAINLFDTLARYSFDAKAKETLYNFYKDLYNYDLVIIDDLGTEVTNSFVTSQLFSCLNERHLNKKATIISTNLNLSEIRDRYSDRVFSRLTSSYEFCKLSGPDVRMIKKVN